MTAAMIAKALGGRKAGATWTARCPAHDDREPSLSIADGDEGKVLVRCHAGCEQHRVIAVLRARGIWPGNGRGGTASVSAADQRRAHHGEPIAQTRRCACGEQRRPRSAHW